MKILTPEIKDLINAEIEKEVEKRIKEYPIHIKIDGIEVDQDSRVVRGGEIEIEINTPFFMSKAG